MKKTNTIYWILTGLFAAFMLFTAIPDILKSPEAVDFMTKLGYPVYFIVFIGIAKTLGAIAIVIPGYPRIKEWAYAGLIFDLIGAFYSTTVVMGFAQSWMLLIFTAFGFASYMYYHKRLKQQAVNSHP